MVEVPENSGEVYGSTGAIHDHILLQITSDTTEGKMETSLDRHGNTILPPATLSGFAASGHSIGTKQILNTCFKTPPHDPISV